MDAIIAVGYRVNFKKATRFRQWATKTLKENIIKGFVLNDDMLKNGKPFGKDYHKYIKWILGDKEQVYILCDYFYIVEGLHRCFKCRKLTRVIGYGVKKYFDVCNPELYGDEKAWSFEDDEIHIASHIYPLPEKLLNYLKDKYGYYESYSKTIQSSYLANHCSNCKVIQGDFFLFGEVDSPFFIDSEERARKLKLYKVPLKNDIIVEADTEQFEVIKKVIDLCDYYVLIIGSK